MYNGAGLPLAQFGGYLSVSGGGGDMYNSYLTRYNTVSNQNSPVSLDINAEIVGNHINMEVNAEVLGNISYSDNRVVFILSSYQDEDYFCSVISYDETPFNLNQLGQAQQYQQTIEIQPSWNLDQLKFVALVQSFGGGGNIIQAKSAPVPLNNLLTMDTQIESILDDEGGDGDGISNPGESIELAIDIKNESIELSTFRQEVTISSSSDFIDIPISDHIYNETIYAGESYLIKIPLTISENIELGDVQLDITISCDYFDNYNNLFTYSKAFQRSIDVNLFQNGFPYITTSQVLTSPAVVNLDLDDINYIIFGDYAGRLHVIDEFGVPKPGFPFDLQDQIWGSPAVADIDLDGEYEIIVCSKNKSLCS